MSIALPSRIPHASTAPPPERRRAGVTGGETSFSLPRWASLAAAAAFFIGAVPAGAQEAEDPEAVPASEPAETEPPARSVLDQDTAAPAAGPETSEVSLRADGTDSPGSMGSSGGAGLAVEPAAADSAVLEAGGAEALAESSLKRDKPEKEGFRFRTGAGAIYDDNIFQAEQGREDDILLSARLGFHAETGAREQGLLSLDYDATGFMYADHSGLDGVNHAANLRTMLNLAKTQLALSASYRHSEGGDQALMGDFTGVTGMRSSASDREAGQFVKRDVASVTADAIYGLAAKTVLKASAGYWGSFYSEERYQDSQNISARLGLGYKITEKTTLGLAGLYGYLDADSNPGQTYQNALLTVDYDATDRLSFSADAGAEFRQYDGDDAPGDRTRPVFHLESTYQMRERTLLRLSGGRRTDGSAVLRGTSIEYTTLSAALEQGLWRSFKLGISGGWETADYQATSGREGADREEKYWFGRASLNYLPSPRTSVGLFYEHRDNDGGDGGLTYEGNRVGLQLGFSF